jgi:3-hydroxybutyryl-CoA dehydrogenase
MHDLTGPAPRVAAVGAGRMGRGIALAFACAGHRIALIDLRRRDAAALQRLRDEVDAELRASLAALVELQAMDGSLVDAVLARIAWVDESGADAALASAELVMEGVPETPQAKQQTFERLGRCCRDDALIASTTSSMLVDTLARLVRNPRRFLNMHWLNPAYVMPVVELSAHDGTDPEVLARARALLEGIGKVPVVCKATPGYIVPRLQALIMNEAARMVEEGAASAEDIDRATRFGLGLRFAALGVLEFVDFGGLDILYHASREMAASVSEQRYATPQLVRAMMERGDLGLKSGRGFYDHATRDGDAYRLDVLRRSLEMLRHARLWNRPSATTLD